MSTPDRQEEPNITTSVASRRSHLHGSESGAAINPPVQRRLFATHSCHQGRRKLMLGKIAKRKLFLADLLRVLVCIPLAMTLAVAAVALVRFSLTRAGAILWMITAILVFFKIRRRIFRN